MKEIIFKQRETLILLFLFSLLYFVTRLINILQMPVFVDEGNYIIWVKQALLQKQYFISLTDGKPPLSLWGEMVFIKLFSENPLLGLRLFSVFCGYISAIGFYLLNLHLFNKKAAVIGTFLFILAPFLLFYDRIGLVDSLVNTMGIFILLFSIRLAEKQTLSNAFIFGVVCGLGLLAKSNIWMYIYLSALAPLLFYRKGMILNDLLKLIRNFAFLFLFAMLIAQLIYHIQLYAPYPDPMGLVSNKNDDFLYTKQELLADPIVIFIKVVPERIMSIIHMTGWIPFFTCIAGFIVLYRKKPMLAIYLFLWFAGPLFATSYLLKFFAARYMIFIATIIILMTGYFLSKMKSKSASILLGTAIVLLFSVLNYPILFDYHKLNFPSFERLQYVEGIGSGYGMTDMVAIAKEKAKEKPVLVVGEGIFGVGSNIFESALPIYQTDIQVTGTWPLNRQVLQNYQPLLKDKHVLVMLNFESIKEVPKDWPLKLIKEYKKPYNTSYYRFYELTP